VLLFGIFEDELNRPAAAAAVFSCLRGGSMATRGRPRKAGERHASGDLRQAADQGTPEHQKKRIDLVGPPRDTRTSQRIQRHEALASYPLGVLYARRLVLSGEHYAGKRYASLFVKAVRPVTLPSILANLVSAGGLPLALALVDDAVDKGAEDRAAYLAAREVLDRRGPLVAKVIDDLVIYEVEPRSQKRLDMIRDGLDALNRHFELVDERTQAATSAPREPITVG
jgi:hypothetical protein